MLHAPLDHALESRQPHGGILEAHCSAGKGDAADQDLCRDKITDKCFLRCQLNGDRSRRVAAGAADQPIAAEIVQIKDIVALHHDVRDEALIWFVRQLVEPQPYDVTV
jgi:hypothetical protein